MISYRRHCDGMEVGRSVGRCPGGREGSMGGISVRNALRGGASEIVVVSKEVEWCADWDHGNGMPSIVYGAAVCGMWSRIFTCLGDVQGK